MDREFPDDIEQEILAVVESNPTVLGVHDLCTRQSGQTGFVQLHLELNRAMPLVHAHAIARKVDDKIKAIVPDAEVIIHQDPVEKPPRGAQQSVVPMQARSLATEPPAFRPAPE